MSVPAAYLGIILIWSTTPLAVQWSTQGAGFAFAVFARMAIGLALAALLIAVWRVGFPLHARARRSYLAGGLGLFGAMQGFQPLPGLVFSSGCASKCFSIESSQVRSVLACGVSAAGAGVEADAGSDA